MKILLVEDELDLGAAVQRDLYRPHPSIARPAAS